MKVLSLKGYNKEVHWAGTGWLVFLCTLLALSFARPFSSTASHQENDQLSTFTTTAKFASSTIAITPAGDLLVVVNPDSNSITLLDTIDYCNG